MNKKLVLLGKRAATGVVLVGIFYIFFILPPYYLSLLLFGIALYIISCEFPRLLPANRLAFWFITPLYLVAPFAMLISLNQHPHYRVLVIYLFILVACFDSFSYLCGSLLGRHRLAPAISPNKTWEGVLGGFIATGVIVASLRYLNGQVGSWISLLLFTTWLCGTALMGDLFESFLKRNARVKDAGAILPGHGGLLDRFDGILFCTYIWYIFKESIVHFFHIS